MLCMSVAYCGNKQDLDSIYDLITPCLYINDMATYIIFYNYENKYSFGLFIYYFEVFCH